MSIVQVKNSGERDTALAAQAAQRITAITQQHLRKDPGLMAVVVEFVAPELWFIANASLASQQLRSFYLNVSTKYN